MAYNKAKEEHKWKKWKEREEQKLRELGMDEASIKILRESDWADFNSDRRFREHQISLLEYMEILLEETDTSEPDIQNVDDLLDMIGDE
jgi:RNA polymerase sigma-70 factor (ECF subfamily)